VVQAAPTTLTQIRNELEPIKFQAQKRATAVALFLD